MKAAALLNVRNLAIAVIIAHQSSRPEVIAEVVEPSKDQPIQAMVQVEMHNLELRSSDNEEEGDEENEEDFAMKKLDKSTQINPLDSVE